MPNYHLAPVSDLLSKDQAFRIFLSNSAYFMMMNGKAPGRETLKAALRERPEEVLAQDKHFCLVMAETDGTMQPAAVVDWLDDFPKKGTRYLGLFMTDAPLHGTGESFEILTWILKGFQREWVSQVRLGVLEANERALRFWAKAGFLPIKTVEHGQGLLSHRIRVLEKQLV